MPILLEIHTLPKVKGQNFSKSVRSANLGHFLKNAKTCKHFCYHCKDKSLLPLPTNMQPSETTRFKGISHFHKKTTHKSLLWAAKLSWPLRKAKNGFFSVLWRIMGDIGIKINIILLTHISFENSRFLRFLPFVLWAFSNISVQFNLNQLIPLVCFTFLTILLVCLKTNE